MLLIVGNSGPLQIPGKIYPALASGRPILYAHQLAESEDPCCKLLKEFPGVVFAGNSETELLRVIEIVDERLESLQCEASLRKSMPELKALESRSIGAEFLRFLQEVVDMADAARCGAKLRA